MKPIVLTNYLLIVHLTCVEVWKYIYQISKQDVFYSHPNGRVPKNVDQSIS